MTAWSLLTSEGPCWCLDADSLGALRDVLDDFSVRDIRALHADTKAPKSSGMTIAAGVATIPIRGTIMRKTPWFFRALGIPATDARHVRRDLAASLANDDVASISLAIDSPGGSAAAAIDIAEAVALAGQRKPIVANVDGSAASAAYWIASQAKTISATRASRAGGIGAYTRVDDASRAYGAQGIRVRLFASGEQKGAGEPGTPVTDAHGTELQRNVDTIAAMFRAAVTAGRGDRLKTPASSLASGATWLAEEARSLGLIDYVHSTFVVETPKPAPEPVPVRVPAPKSTELSPQDLAKLVTHVNNNMGSEAACDLIDRVVARWSKS